MLYLANLIRYPYTGTLQYQPNEPTKFGSLFEQNTVYKWFYSRALNETCEGKLLNYDERNLTLLFNGLIDNPDKKYLKFEFDIRVRLANGTDFSLSKNTVLCVNSHNIINKKFKLDALVKKFIFQPYRDIIYITMTVKNNNDETDTNPIKLKFETLGFDLLQLQ